MPCEQVNRPANALRVAGAARQLRDQQVRDDASLRGSRADGTLHVRRGVYDRRQRRELDGGIPR